MSSTKLIIIRGNSGSGKSTLAKAVRERMVSAGIKTALVEQDYMRRIVLKEKEAADGDNIDLIGQTVEFALGRGYSVVLEGILYFPSYGKMLERLISMAGSSHIYYMDMPLEETLRRHSTKPNAHEFGEKEMRQWWNEADLTGFDGEKMIPSVNSLDMSVDQVIGDVVSISSR